MVDNLELIRERIRSMRYKQGLSLQELSERTHISKSTLQRYETGGIRNLPLDKLAPLAKALHTTPAYLMGWENDNGEIDVSLSIYDIAKELDVRWENVEAILDGKPTPDTLDPETTAQIRKRLQYARLLAAEPTIPPGFDPLPPMTVVPRVGTIACGEPILAEQNIEDYDKVPADWRANFTLVCEGDSMLPCIQNGDVVAIRRQPTVENGDIAAVRIGDEATLKHVYLHADYIELRPENPAFPSIIRRRDEMNDVHIEGKAVGLCRLFR